MAVTLIGACSVPPATDTGSNSGTQSGVNETASTTSATLGQTTDTSGQSNPTGGILCPNGVLDEGEICDDGNLAEGDGCNSDCTESGTLLREYRSSTPGNEAVYGVTATSDGAIFVGGEQSRFRWIARFNEDLKILWTNTLKDGGGDQAITGISANQEGLYAVGGVGESNAHDIWVARYSLDGNLEWENVSGEDGEDYASQIAIAPNGDVLVSALEQTNDSSSLWLRRYSSGGSSIWTSSWPLSISIKSFPIGPGLHLTSDAAIVGFSTFTADTAPEFLIQFPLTGGAPVWQLEIPETSGNILGLASLPGGDLVATSSHLFETLTVRRITDQGSISWASTKCVGKIGRDIVADNAGDIVVIGDGPGNTGSNIRLCKLAPDGSLRWGKDIDGGFGDDFGFTVAVDTANRILAGGQMFVDAENRDAWVAVFAP